MIDKSFNVDHPKCYLQYYDDKKRGGNFVDNILTMKDIFLLFGFVLIAASCKDSIVVNNDDSDTISNRSSDICDFQGNASLDSIADELISWLFFDNVIKEDLLELSNLELQTEYLCEFYDGSAYLDQFATISEIKGHMSTAYASTRQVAYMTEGVDIYLGLLNELAVSYTSIDSQALSCYLVDRYDVLETRNPDACRRMYDECMRQAARSAVRTLGLGALETITLTGTATVVGSPISGAGVAAGGFLSTLAISVGGWGWDAYWCEMDYRDCLRNGQGGNGNGRRGPLPFGSCG